MYKITLTLGLLIFVKLAYAQDTLQGVKFVSANYFEVLEMAKKQNKPVFLEFGVNCGYCFYMKRDIFTKEVVGSFYNENFISLIVDEKSDIGKDLAERFNVYSYPTHFYLNSNGEIIHIAANYKSDKKIIKEGQKALDKKVYAPSGVWWNKLKTRSKKTYLLFNSANIAFLNLTDYSVKFSTDKLTIKELKNIKEDRLKKIDIEIQKSLVIEEYYFNTFVAAITNYLAGNYILAKKYANKALTGFPHHQRTSRKGTRDDLLSEILSQIENKN